MKAVALSSGGLDSTTCLALAIKKLGAENVSTVSIFYGQRHERELSCARKVADYYKVTPGIIVSAIMFAVFVLLK